MLAAYRQAAAARAALGIPPLPLTAQETAALVELLISPPADEDPAFLLDLLANRVPPGVDDASRVKASFLAAVAEGSVHSPLLTRERAAELLGTMQGGYNVKPLIDLLDDATLAPIAAQGLKHTLLLPIYLPEDYRAPFVDPLTATGPAVAEILARPAQYQGQTLPVIGDILSLRDIVATFSRVTGIRAEYRSAYDRDGLLHHFPAFAANELLVQELLGMTSYAVEYGYYRPERDLAWSRRIDPTAFTWEQFLHHSGWRGEAVPLGVAH